MIGIVDSEALAAFWWKIAHIGIAFIPVTIFHTICIFCEIKNIFAIRLAYVQALLFIFAALSGTNLFISRIRLFDGYYYITAGLLYYVFFAIWVFIIFYTHYRLFLKHNELSNIKKTQIKYFFVGILLGFSGGITNFLPVFEINVSPFGNFTIPFYCLIVTYAILKHRLLDISLVITRTGIFVAVYSIVLGIPFALAFGWQERLINLFGSNWWVVPLITSTVLATAGPFIYLFIQKRAEAALLQEQRQYQMTLQQASLGMGQIKEMKRLLTLVVHIITRAVSVEHAEVYLLHEESKQYILKASRGWRLKGKEQFSVLSLDSPLVRYLKENRESVVYEEIEHYAQDNDLKKLKEAEETIRQLDGALIVPSFIDQKLIAILVLGNKKAGKVYTQDDLAVFTILANQAGLAIENAQFYEKMKETHVQLVKAEKMATVGTMADGLSHQINNRLHAMGFIAGDAMDTIRLKKKEGLPKDMRELLDEIEHSLSKIEDNVKRGGEIVEGLLKYTRKGAEGFEAINLNKLLDASLEMVQFKIKLAQMNLIRNFDDTIPSIKGNFTQLQEVFFNIIDNAYDAMMQRKAEMKEPGYEANLRIWAGQNDGKLEILIEDNGIGVKKKDLEKLFTPFFTTKLSSKKGTGLGLYVIRQIIEENHGGKVKFTSQYRRGSQTRILLPILFEESGSTD